VTAANKVVCLLADTLLVGDQGVIEANVQVGTAIINGEIKRKQ